ncbi:MAG TPA: hypothetical protein VLA48_02545 [Nitrososphaeraceae archaeon]|nr:hypothetical protein [Nitrososphaeraceae archaeon]
MEDVKYNLIKRVEVINHSKDGEGRAYIKRGNFEVEIQVQDDGTTLKIFLSDSKEE